jgi:hypothetical protein
MEIAGAVHSRSLMQQHLKTQEALENCSLLFFCSFIFDVRNSRISLKLFDVDARICFESDGMLACFFGSAHTAGAVSGDDDDDAEEEEVIFAK